jgi:hypothetical protein
VGYRRASVRAIEGAMMLEFTVAVLIVVGMACIVIGTYIIHRYAQ